MAVDCALSLVLYVGGGADAGRRSRDNLRRALEENGLAASLEVVDVLEDVDRAIADGVLVTPTLVRRGGERGPHLIGNLSNRALLDAFLQEER